MASNLLIAHAAWGRSATLSTTKSTDSDHPVTNVIYGGREAFVRDADATANNQGYTFGTGTTITPDRLVIGNINWGLDLDSGATDFQVRLQASTNGFTSLVFDSGFQTFSAASYVHGPRSEDAVFVPDDDFPDTVGSFQAANSWRVLHRTASPFDTIQLMLSKIYLCESFDFGRDPIANYDVSFQRSGWGRQVGKRLTLTWQGVTNSKVEEFRNDHLAFADMCNLFLIEETDAVLAGDKCLFVRIEDFSARPITYNSNEVRIVFQEVV